MVKCTMQNIDDTLERLFAKVRALPEERRRLAADVLKELADADTYRLSEDERAVLKPALERAMRGEFATDAEVRDAIDAPWN